MTGLSNKMPRVLWVGLKTYTKITMMAYVVIFAFDEGQLGVILLILSRLYYLGHGCQANV